MTVDNNGAATIRMMQPALDWQVITATLQIPTGAPTWKAGIGPGTGNSIVHMIDQGVGNFVRIGPIVLAPGENIVIAVAGGTPGDQLSGSFYGLQGINPLDIPGYAQSSTAVAISAGNVSISNSPNVSVIGTPNVNIANTPSVNIANVATVILGAGTATVGSISAIQSTVTVAGTINVGNTASVTITGTPTVNIGNSPAVTITSGTIDIGNISGGTVNVGNTPNITITGQTITIGIGGVQHNTGGAPTDVAGAAKTSTIALQINTQALLLYPVNGFLNQLQHVKIAGHTTGMLYFETYIFPDFIGHGANYSPFAVVPIPTAVDTSIDVTVQASIAMICGILELMQSVPEFMEYYNPPWEYPNQLPITGGTGIIANNARGAIIGEATNVTIYIHRLYVRADSGTPNYDLETAIGGGAGTQRFWGYADGAMIDMDGAALPQGYGLYLRNLDATSHSFNVGCIYSKG